MANINTRGHAHIKKAGLILFLLIVTVVIGLAIASTRFFSYDEWVEFDASKLENMSQTLLVFDQGGHLAASVHGLEDRTKVSLDQVPPIVRQAFVSAEDARFYSHPGFDLYRVFGALYENLKTGDFNEGASTITQQMIKNSHLTKEKTIERKVQEVFLAWQMEQKYSKDEILEMYLNYNYFGRGAYGIQAAAHTYFQKNVTELTAAEGALLAGILKSQTRYAPHIRPDLSLERRNLVLSLMEKYGYLSPEEARTAQSEPLGLNLAPQEELSYGYYIDEVIQEAAEKLNMNIAQLYDGGYRVYTQLNPDLQAYCERIMQDGVHFPETAPDGVKPEGAIAVVEAQTGYVSALVGGREYTTRLGFNRATQLRRQPGSTIKPVLCYAPAIEYLGLSPTTLVDDETTDFNGYTPHNFAGAYYGQVPLRFAVAKSLNVPAVELLYQVGIDRAKQYASSVGIPFSEGDDHLALALGGFSSGVSPLELCGAYQPFATGGSYIKPAFIQRIEDANGGVVYRRDESSRKKALSRVSAAIVSSMLQSVVSEGTGSELGAYGMTLSGKSGTVDFGGAGNRDAWMIAYSAEYIASVWMGYDQPSAEHCLPKEVTGGTLPARILGDVFWSLYQGRQPPQPELPEGLEWVEIDKIVYENDGRAVLCGALAPAQGRTLELFRTDDVPHEISDYWTAPIPPTDIHVALNNNGQPLIRFMPPQPGMIYRVYRQRDYLPEQIVYQYSGSGKDMVYVVDQGAVLGYSYSYTIVPVHPILKNGDEPLTGKASDPVRIFVGGSLLPDLGQHETPQPEKTPVPEMASSRSPLQLFP